MTYLLLQTFLLLLASYFLGAFVACMVKQAFFATGEEVPAHVLTPAQIDVPVRPPVVMPPQVARSRPRQRVSQPITPRAIDPVQPKIEVLRRPEPRPAPAVLDPYRFERALVGPDPNEGVPRIAIAEIRPSVLKPVTDVYRPRPPEPPPAPPRVEELPEESIAEPEAQPSEVPAEDKKPRREGGLAARLRDATTAAAAGAVAAAKAAAAASTAIPAMFPSRRSAGGETSSEETSSSKPEASAELVPDGTTSTLSGTGSEVAAEEAVPEAVEERTLAAEPEEEPQTEPPAPRAEAPVVASEVIEGGDDFQRIRAIDGEIEQKLKARGITYFEHIAAWSTSDVKRMGQELDIPGRIEREQWVEQAQILAKGGETYYSRNRRSALKANAPSPTNASEQRSSFGEEADTNGSRAEAPSGVAAASHGRSVAEMAAAAAAAIAAASASVTRGLKPIEPISPLSKVDPKISIPARITDAIREKEAVAALPSVPDEPVQFESDDNERADDLKRIRGIGVLIEKRLNAIGIRRYEQIANWTSGDIDRVSRMLEFKGRIERESWVEQARILASGGQTEFSRRVDRGEVDTSRET
jgi:predicted flap endonuclease-1-like 5' DNA nuclease